MQGFLFLLRNDKLMNSKVICKHKIVFVEFMSLPSKLRDYNEERVQSMLLLLFFLVWEMACTPCTCEVIPTVRKRWGEPFINLDLLVEANGKHHKGY